MAAGLSMVIVACDEPTGGVANFEDTTKFTPCGPGRF